MTRPLPPAECDLRVNIADTERCRTLSIRVRQFGEVLVGRIGGVDSVRTLGHGLGGTGTGTGTGTGLGRIPCVLAGVQCLQGLEPGSSPTSGTVFPQVRGFLVFFRVHIVHTLASDLMFRVCGVPETAYSVV